jgi:hypothetical protein
VSTKLREKVMVVNLSIASHQHNFPWVHAKLYAESLLEVNEPFIARDCDVKGFARQRGHTHVECVISNWHGARSTYATH